MRKKICFVVAVPGTALSFLPDHIERLSKDYDIYLAGNIKDAEEIKNLKLKGWQHIDIMRQISLANDVKALLQLRKYFSKMKFDAVHSVTPKAGLLTAMAAKMAGVKHRIHIFTGQVWATKTGAMRTLLKSMDKLIATLDNNILVDGSSQRQFLINENVVSEKKSKVLGDGSISGVNTARFCPSDEVRQNARKQLGISDDKLVFVFMGRLNHDKGLYELLPAFDRLASARKNVFLLIFGSDEEDVASSFPQYKNLNKDNFLYYGPTPEPQNMLQAGDVFVLPTYREGFGSSVIEAACLGLPTITSDAYGVLDASVPGETGLQCKVGDIDSLYQTMLRMTDEKALRESMGKAGRKRVLSKFAGDVVVQHWADFYNNLLTDNK